MAKLMRWGEYILKGDFYQNCRCSGAFFQIRFLSLFQLDNNSLLHKPGT